MAGVFKKIKSFMLAEDEDDYGQDDYYEEEFEEEEVAPTVQISRSKSNEKILNLHNIAKESDIVYVMPTNVNDAPVISKHVKDNKTCIIKIQGLSGDEAQSIADFVAGAVYVLNGSLKKISDDIFIATPATVNLKGDFSEEKKQSSSMFNFIK